MNSTPWNNVLLHTFNYEPGSNIHHRLKVIVYFLFLQKQIFVRLNAISVTFQDLHTWHLYCTNGTQEGSVNRGRVFTVLSCFSPFMKLLSLLLKLGDMPSGGLALHHPQSVHSSTILPQPCWTWTSRPSCWAGHLDRCKDSQGFSAGSSIPKSQNWLWTDGCSFTYWASPQAEGCALVYWALL